MKNKNKNNKNNKTKNINIIQLNKANGNFSNRVIQIDDAIQEYKADVIIVNEANLARDDYISQYRFNDFVMEKDNLAEKAGVHRTIVLVRNSINYKRCKNLESESNSVIWLKITIDSKDKFYLQATYRQWKVLKQKESDSIFNQLKRWEKQISKWKEANMIGEVITVGDMNLNVLDWDKDEKDRSNHDKSLNSLTNLLRKEITEIDTVLINEVPTWNIDNNPKLLDHIYSNKPQKIINVESNSNTFSDHTIQVFKRIAKQMIAGPKYKTSRDLKNYDKEQLNENIINNEKYIETLESNDTEEIAKNIQKIIVEELDKNCPIKTIQIGKKRNRHISKETVELIDKRNKLQKTAKITKDKHDAEAARVARNAVNERIAKENYSNNYKIFKQVENNDINSKWKIAKQLAGINEKETPHMIIENGICHTKAKDIADSFNKQYIEQISETVNKIGNSKLDPIELYKNAIKTPKKPFNFKQINMSDLRKSMSKIKISTATTKDHISFKIMKDTEKAVNPMTMNLINTAFKYNQYPSINKINKIQPTRKKGKDATLIDGWRPVNIVESLSKPIDRVMMQQLTEYMVENNLISPNHHGNVKGKSTQTIVTEIVDKLIEALDDKQEAAVIATDQSKAYDIISHSLLKKKMKIMGLSDNAMELMDNYLKGRCQYVQIDGINSEELSTKDRSVCQGSTLSGLLYLIYTLDVTDLFHNTKHTQIEDRECKKTSIKTYVDDMFPLVVADNDEDINNKIKITINKINDYMKCNKLALNIPKTQVTLITKNKTTKDMFKIEIGTTEIKNSNQMNILGITINDQLNWKQHTEIGQSSLIRQLKIRIYTLSKILKFMDDKMRISYTNAIYRGKYLYGIENWGGCGKTQLTTLQNLQDKAMSMAIGKEANKMTLKQKLIRMGWRSMNEEIEYFTNLRVHKLINQKEDSEIKSLLTINKNGLHMQNARKLDPKPIKLIRSKAAKATLRNRAYQYNMIPTRLTMIRNPKIFKEQLKEYYDKK